MIEQNQENYTTKDSTVSNEMEKQIVEIDWEKETEIEKQMNPFREETAELKQEVQQQTA